MRRYIDYAIIWDLLLVIIVGLAIYFLKPALKVVFTLPKVESLFSFGISLITVSATLFGFLLTIITVIVTFKKGFDEKTGNEESETSTNPPKNVFDRHISKEQKFYGGSIYKNVVNVFINSTYEIGIALLILLFIQFNIVTISKFLIALISFGVFIILMLTIIRCLYIFKLFLNVHIHK